MVNFYIKMTYFQYFNLKFYELVLSKLTFWAGKIMKCQHSQIDYEKNIVFKALADLYILFFVSFICVTFSFCCDWTRDASEVNEVM